MIRILQSTGITGSHRTSLFLSLLPFTRRPVDRRYRAHVSPRHAVYLHSLSSRLGDRVWSTFLSADLTVEYSLIARGSRLCGGVVDFAQLFAISLVDEGAMHRAMQHVKVNGDLGQ